MTAGFKQKLEALEREIAGTAEERPKRQALTARQIGEFEARDFLGDDEWKKLKRDYDECMAFRKTIKGKPTEEQMTQINLNAEFIKFYGAVMFHSVSLGPAGCACTRCGYLRQNPPIDKIKITYPGTTHQIIDAPDNIKQTFKKFGTLPPFVERA